MPSLHMLGHMVAMAVIATLVKQIMELNAEVNKLKDQLEDIKESPGCYQDNSDNDQEEKDKATNEVHMSEEKEYSSDRTEKECVKNKSVERETSRQSTITSGQSSEDIPSVYSSVWCHGSDNQLCQFENICYNTEAEEFVFFRHKSSTLENVKMEDGSITLDLSSFRGHNVLQTTMVSLPSVVLPRFQINWVNESTLVFKPFLADNLMHVFHDDIIPLHHTLKLITLSGNMQRKEQPFNVQLFVFDNDLDIDDEILKFYEVFSKFRMKSKNDFQSEGKMVCFKSLFFGLSTTTTWYDYGFSKPQGPLLNYKADGAHIKSTASYIRQQLITPSKTFASQDYLVLFTRKENRKILNEYELILKLMKNVGMKVMSLNFESYTLLELIMFVSHSRGIIAMHGSLLILSLFLKPGSVVIELYPYAVNPSNYTPYKTLTGLKGMGLIYKAWTNQNKENSVGFPDRPPEFGGLNHLENDAREVIVHQTDVPPHTCCKDPSWLYHIYQDTLVNTTEVSALAEEALSKSQTKILKENSSGKIFYPSKVQNVLCNVLHNSGEQSRSEKQKLSLKMQWDVPWTMSYIEFETLHYEILVQQLDADNVQSYQTAVNEFVVDMSFQGNCYVWVRGVINNSLTGPYSQATLCETDLK